MCSLAHKIMIMCYELGIPYNKVAKDLGDGPNGIKHADFLAINPNGRVPAIIDPNNGDQKVWERYIFIATWNHTYVISAAILQYLERKYDHERKLAGKTEQQQIDIDTLLYFQISGLGYSISHSPFESC